MKVTVAVVCQTEVHRGSGLGSGLCMSVTMVAVRVVIVRVVMVDSRAGVEAVLKEESSWHEVCACLRV